MAGTDLFISRLIRAPRAAVWRGWTDPELFAQWPVPGPTECRVLQMQLRPSGGFEPHLQGCFLEVVPGERLVSPPALQQALARRSGSWQRWQNWGRGRRPSAPAPSTSPDRGA